MKESLDFSNILFEAFDCENFYSRGLGFLGTALIFSFNFLYKIFCFASISTLLALVCLIMFELIFSRIVSTTFLFCSSLFSYEFGFFLLFVFVGFGGAFFLEF